MSFVTWNVSTRSFAMQIHCHGVSVESVDRMDAERPDSKLRVRCTGELWRPSDCLIEIRHHQQIRSPRAAMTA